MCETDFNMVAEEAAKNLAKARAVSRYVNTNKFFEIFIELDEGQRLRLIEVIKLNDLDRIKRIAMEVFELDNYSLRQLRSIARDLGIKNYCSYAKLQLATAIQEKTSE